MSYEKETYIANNMRCMGMAHNIKYICLSKDKILISLPEISKSLIIIKCKYGIIIHQIPGIPIVESTF